MRQGEHLSSISGDGGAYRGDRLLREVRDARQLSLRATLRDPFERLWVREYLNSATIDLWVFADASGSMRAASSSAGQSGVEVAGRLIQSAALSARGSSDRLGVYCSADRALDNCCSPASRQSAQSLAVGQRIQALPATTPGESGANSAAGLFNGIAGLGAQRTLVFLISDFHPARCDWRALLRGMAAHDVVPIVVWNLPDALLADQSGLLSLRDAETGRDTMVWMRQSLKRRMLSRLDEHFETCEHLFRQHGRRAVHLYDGYEAAALTRYFYGARQRRSPGMRLSQLSR